MHPAINFFRRFMESRGWRAFLLLMSIAGALYGYYYYRFQLSSSPLYLWLFIPDCPLFVTIFAYIVWRYGRDGWRRPRLDAFAFFGLVKYGLWTLFVILYYLDIYTARGSGSFQATLFSLHVGMVLLGLALLPILIDRRQEVSSRTMPT